MHTFTFTLDELLQRVVPILSLDQDAFFYTDIVALWCVFHAPWKETNAMVITYEMETCMDVMVVPKTNWADSTFYKAYDDLTVDDFTTLKAAESTTFRYIVYA